ncbi:MAG: response regulator transcription factor [Anaerolineae bacterium]|nr:response regulator transcription factor [Anaerolineae bacterium]
MSIRVLIADDHKLFRQGVRQICEIKGHFEVVGEANNGQEAVELARELEPDVILMDIQMSVLDGVQATQRIMTNNPGSRVIVLTMYRRDAYVFEAIKAGARGYLLKDVDWRDLVNAIHKVYEGQALIDPVMAVRVLDEFRRSSSRDIPAESLTDGEMNVLVLVARGLDNAAIATELSLAEKTITNRLSSIYQKLHVNNRTQAALYALRQGWATLDNG